MKVKWIVSYHYLMILSFLITGNMFECLLPAKNNTFSEGFEMGKGGVEVSIVNKSGRNC